MKKNAFRKILGPFKGFLVLVLLLSSPAVKACAQAPNGITTPRDNAEVSGVVLIEGTATDLDFLRYELSFFKEFDPTGDWVVFATGDRPVVNGVLAVWDTTVGREAGSPFYLDGTYRLRLRVVRQDSNYDEFFVLGISLSNDRPMITPTDTPEPQVSASPLPTSALAVPTELSTLTPFPTATHRPTVEAVAETPEADTSPPGSAGSILDLEGEFSAEQIKAGFCQGVNIALAFFVVLAGYFLFRGALRLLLSSVRKYISR